MRGVPDSGSVIRGVFLTRVLLVYYTFWGFSKCWNSINQIYSFIISICIEMKQTLCCLFIPFEQLLFKLKCQTVFVVGPLYIIDNITGPFIYKYCSNHMKIAWIISNKAMCKLL
jgi:hypothetical protein